MTCTKSFLFLQYDCQHDALFIHTKSTRFRFRVISKKFQCYPSLIDWTPRQKRVSHIVWECRVHPSLRLGSTEIIYERVGEMGNAVDVGLVGLWCRAVWWCRWGSGHDSKAISMHTVRSTQNKIWNRIVKSRFINLLNRLKKKNNQSNPAIWGLILYL